MRSAVRILVLICVAASVAGALVWGVSSLLAARADLSAASPMQLEKRVGLAGPYGAAANKSDVPDQPQISGALFAPKASTSTAMVFAPLVIEHPQVAEAEPLPPARPLPRDEVAVVAPPAAPPIAAPPAVRSPPRNEFADLTQDSRTAIYDISARTVYLPNGKRLEAHSGLGEKMDKPQFVHEKMRGPTPPNVYALSLREQLFHGVRAIRLTPLDDSKMFGRDGILAHTYMLGPNGQSNGCVSFDDYPAFLNAYMKGEVERLVVVSHLPKSSAPALMSMRQDRERYY